MAEIGGDQGSPLYPRYGEERVRTALADTRVVLIAGPRQSGKTTLARQVAGDATTYLTLDNGTTLAAARADPVGFVRGFDRVVIDEVQRVPELLLAIKEDVDRDGRPGRYLLTGSANLMTLPRVADSLAGRMEVVRLLPLAQAELRRRPSAFLRSLFEGLPLPVGDLAIGADLVEVVLGGGYPEALARQGERRRQAWYLDYVDAVVQRDVRDVAQVDQLQQMPRLIRVLAQHAGQLANRSALGAPLAMNHVTTQRYLGILEQLFLIGTVQPWSSNTLKRLTRTPKLHFLDSGLLAALRDLTAGRLAHDRTPFGPLLETFVLAEILKLSSWSEDRYELAHFRDRDGNEVDLVLEDRRGRVVGIEVKAAATVRQDAFSGLRRLAEACGDRFSQGIVLYDHDQVIPFGERLKAVPLSALWG